jgi:hypothetical protein
MNVLDYWSGDMEHSLRNWKDRDWGWVVQRATGEDIQAITCFDPLCITSDTPLRSTQGDIVHFTSQIRDIIGKKYDVVCLLHPNPATIGGYWVLPGEEGFQTFRYLPVVNQIIAATLNPGGHVLVQFDDEMWEKWSEIFLQELLQYTWSKLSLTTHWENRHRFPSDSYRFHSFHHLRKVWK